MSLVVDVIGTVGLLRDKLNALDPKDPEATALSQITKGHGNGCSGNGGVKVNILGVQLQAVGTGERTSAM
jgi:hypothetical protein